MGLVLSEEFLGVFVMEKRRESMETHSEGKDGDPETTKSTFMAMMMLMIMLMTERFPKKKMATREPPITYSGLRG